MTRTIYRLALALVLSVLLHLAPLLGELIQSAPPPPPPAPLTARLRPPPAATTPPLTLAEPPPAKPAPNPPAKPVLSRAGAGKPRNWQSEVREQFRQQHERGDFYPAEAIARGLEGEVLVFLLLDAGGQVAAARVEQSSGQRILDDAALQAVRSLRSLPADAPRETLLPVRFRLR